MNPLNHVAIIMDGNGRWGLKKKNNRNYGHKEGLKVIHNIINETIKQNITYLTLFTFSTENWKRPKKEIIYLFNLLENFLKKDLDKIHKKNIKLKFLGKKLLSKKLNKLIRSSEKLTDNNKALQLNLALNYGSKSEIINCIKNMLKKKIIINEKNIDKNLFTKDLPDPDMLIRTGNQKRLSNFMLWQMAYTEMYFIRKLWPDFKISDFRKIIHEYKKTKRKFGSI